jgi:hypothetical protein
MTPGARLFALVRAVLLYPLCCTAEGGIRNAAISGFLIVYFVFVALVGGIVLRILGTTTGVPVTQRYPSFHLDLVPFIVLAQFYPSLYLLLVPVLALPPGIVGACVVDATHLHRQEQANLADAPLSKLAVSSLVLSFIFFIGIPLSIIAWWRLHGAGAKRRGKAMVLGALALNLTTAMLLGLALYAGRSRSRVLRSHETRATSRFMVAKRDSRIVAASHEPCRTISNKGRWPQQFGVTLPQFSGST